MLQICFSHCACVFSINMENLTFILEQLLKLNQKAVEQVAGSSTVSEIRSVPDFDKT